MGKNDVSPSRASEIADRAARDAESARNSNPISEILNPSYHGDSYKGVEKVVYDVSFRKK